MINKISFYDFDGTLIYSPNPETGKKEWERIKGKPYPHIGWWGRSESLDLEVFDIKPIRSVLSLIKEDISNPNTFVVVLTSRLKKLEEPVKDVLNGLNIYPDVYDLKKDNKNKGERVLEYLKKFPDIHQINVYDDNYEREIISYKNIETLIPKNIDLNIFYVVGDKIKKINENKIKKIIYNEINMFL